MARPGAKKSPEAPPPAEPSPALAADAPDPVALAEGILARTIRPRAADIRRLAEAVLAGASKPDKKKKKKKAEGKKRKLSRIPGRKGGK
jgi:hypothetical protein